MEKLKLRAAAAAAAGAISAEAMSICLFLLITIFLSAAFGIGIGIGSEQQLLHNNKEGLPTKAYTSLSERVKAMFSLSSTTPPPTPTPTPTPRIWSSSWNKAQSLFNQLQAYFFPPNLDFRGTKEVESDGGAAGKKVKEAMAKSFGKSKATVEDSAKSAAKFAGETLHITADKVKKSFSHPDHHHQTSSDDDQAEL